MTELEILSQLNKDVGALLEQFKAAAQDIGEIKAHLAAQNGRIATVEKEQAISAAWRGAHNAEHRGKREDQQASADRRVEWVKAAAPYVGSLLSATVLVLWLLGIAPAGAARALDMRVPDPTGVPVVAPAVTPTATGMPDLRGGGGPAFWTPTPIVPRNIVEVPPDPRRDEPLAHFTSITILRAVSLRDCSTVVDGNLIGPLPQYPRSACPVVSVEPVGGSRNVAKFYEDRDGNRWGFVLVNKNWMLIAVCYGGVSYVQVHENREAGAVGPYTPGVAGCAFTDSK